MKDLAQLLKSSHRESVCWNPIRVQLSDGTFRPVPCKGRRASVCRPCSQRYKADWTRIFISGMLDEDGAVYEGFDYYWLTLTAPSFGLVHRKNNCPCGIRHSAEEEEQGLFGVPLNVTDALDGLVPEDCSPYDYSGQVQWQLAQGSLWQALKERLRYFLGDDVAWMASREAQARQVIHYHSVIRVPQGRHSAEYVREALAGLRKTKTRSGIGFGSQFDLQKISEGSHAKFARYSSKVLTYSAKSLLADKADDAGVVLHPARVAYEARLRLKSRAVSCLKREGCSEGCRSGAHSNYGYAGRPATTSRNWSFEGLNRTVLKQRRREWVMENGSETATETYEDLLMRAIFEDSKTRTLPRPFGQIEKAVAGAYWFQKKQPNEDVPIPLLA